MPITKRQAADVQNTAMAQAQGRTAGGITPEGVIEITENGLFDVAQYAQANVNVSGVVLPSSISKIDGGSFTTSSTTAASTYRIEHNLGELPQGFFVWCEEEKAFQTGDRNYYLIWAVGAKGDIKTSETVTQFYAIDTSRRNTTGAVSGVGATATNEAQTNNFATTQDFCVYKTGDLFYRSGYTYKWIAWA